MASMANIHLWGDSGWYVRNEVSSVIPRLNTEVYLGLDVGAVYGKSTESLVGEKYCWYSIRCTW